METIKNVIDSTLFSVKKKNLELQRQAHDTDPLGFGNSVFEIHVE